MEALLNYRNLVARIDGLCREIMREHADKIACRQGCDSCCRHISLFWVEAVNLNLALRRLPETLSSFIRDKAGTVSADAPCPLLENGVCLLYQARPIICRTHGMPIITRSSLRTTVDFCPRNFRGVESLPGSSIIDVDLVNTSLVAINALFVSVFFKGGQPEQERLTIADALLLDDPRLVRPPRLC